MVDLLQIVSAIVGFGPPLFLLYYTVRDYTFPRVKEPFFDDSRIFKFFALGIVIGMVYFALEEWGGTLTSTDSIILLVVLFAILEEAIKLVILNYPKFQRKVDTAFIGLALGLGIAMTFTFATVYSTLLDVEDPGAFEMVAYSLLGLQFVLLHGSTTATIGVGVARGEAKGYFMDAFLIHVGFGLFYESFFVVELIPPPLNLLGLVGASAIVVYAYAKVHRELLPRLIRDAKRLAQKSK